MKKKEGLSRLLEIAGEKKSLLLFSGLFSAISALCILIPFWSIYEILKELLVHASDLSTIDSELMISWGWLAFIALIVGVLFLYAGLMLSHIAAFRILYGLKIKLSEHIGQLSLGYLNSTSIGCIKKIMEQKCRKNRAFYSSHYSRFGECVCNHNFYVYYLFFFKWLDGIHRSIMHTFKYRNAIF